MNNKVIFFINSLHGGGAERVVSNLTINLSEDIETKIVVINTSSDSYDYKGELLHFDEGKRVSLLSKYLSLFRHASKLNLIKKQNPSVPVISFLELPNLINMLSLNTKNSYVSVRNYMSVKHQKGLKSMFWNLSIKYLYKRAKKIIVVSNQIKEDLINKYKLPVDKITVIYNFYNIEKIEKLAREKLDEEEKKIFNKPTIINVGRLSHQKGQEHLLCAFKKVKAEIPNAQLVLLGKGELQPKLEKLTRQLELTDSVHFLGFQKNPFKYISKSRVFVMSSYYEGFPNALAEAMACGVPVISTDCKSGPREIIAPDESQEEIDYQKKEDRFGVLVPDFCKENKQVVENAISEAICNILSDDNEKQYFSNKSKERIQEFDVNRVIRQWEDLIRLH